LKIFLSLLIFACAAAIAYASPVLRDIAVSYFKRYRDGVNSLVSTSMAGIQKSIIVRLELLTAAAAIACALLAGQVLFIILALPFMIALPKLYVSSEQRKYEKEYYNGLPGFLESVISNLKAGSSISRSFQVVAERDKGPIGKEMGLVLKKLELGKSMQDALNELAGKMPVKENEIVIAAINTALETGGNITEVLSNILDTIRKREELGREVRTLTSQGVLSGIIVGLLPVFMIGIISILDPGFISPLFTTPVGLALLAAAVVMEGTGAFIISRIVDVK
jgi:tight adherence protein B